MSSRLLISVLCVGAVAFACGPRARNDAATPKQTSALALQTRTATPRVARKTSNARAQDKKPVIAGELYVHSAASTLRLALHVVNTGNKRVELRFPSGQTHDFVVLDSMGREVWRWASGRMFTQAVRNKLLAAGETLELEETWQGAALPPGRYTAKAVLSSHNYPLVRQAEFTVSGSTVASR